MHAIVNTAGSPIGDRRLSHDQPLARKLTVYSSDIDSGWNVNDVSVDSKRHFAIDSMDKFAIGSCCTPTRIHHN